MIKKLSLIALALACPIGANTSFANAEIDVNVNKTEAKIEPNLFGQFAEHLGHCVYGGIWVGKDSEIPNTRGIRNDVIEALKELKVPVVRWPGGCFADEYHWKDGIGPQELRPKMMNTNWGRVIEDNSFGTHEFLDFCELIGAAPYIGGNMGTGSPREMAEWVEYMTSDKDTPMADLRRKNGREEPWKIPYLGVGNESWGCGGNMRAEYYTDLYLRFSTFIKNYAGNNIYKIASGSSAEDFNWTEVMMKRANKMMNGISLHFYAFPTGEWEHKGSATEFDETEWFSTLRNALSLEDFILLHSDVMDQYDPEKKIGLIVDEWGTWTDPEPGSNPAFLYQQNTLRDALVVGLSMNIFIDHADRVKMANIAQMVNVLQTMLLVKDDKMVKTPTYYAFKMLNVHQGATELSIHVDSDDYGFEGEYIPAVNAAASKDAQGHVNISLCNLDPNEAQEITINLEGFDASTFTGTILTADDITAHNTFENPDTLTPAAFNDATIKGGNIEIMLPSKSLVVLTLK